METLFAKHVGKGIREVRGNLATSDLESHKEQLLDFYKKYDFEIRLYDKGVNIGGEVVKCYTIN